MKTAFAAALIFLHALTAANAAPGDLDAGYDPNAGGIALCFALQPDGKLLVGGDLNVGGQPQRSISRLNANGTVDSTFNPRVEGEVDCLAVQSDGKILAGGSLIASNAEGATRSRVARFNPDGRLDMSFNPVVDDVVLGITEGSDGKLFLSGQFTSVNGVTRQGVARLNANGTLDDGFRPNLVWIPPGLANGSFALEQPDGKIILGGGFRSVSGVDRWGCARVDASGAVDPAFNPHLVHESAYGASLLPDGRMILRGPFTSVGGVSRLGMARVNANGSVDTGFNPGPNSSVFASSLQTDGTMEIGGEFSRIGSAARPNFARINSNGVLSSAFVPVLSGNVYCTAIQQDGKIILGGAFQTVNGVTRNVIARLENGAATESLTVASLTNVRWLRGGTSPELSRTTFEVSTDSGATWALLGKGVPISGGWELTGLSLPSSGLVRARGRSADSNQNGLYQSQTAFSFAPEIAVHAGGDTGAPQITDGQAAPVEFGTVRWNPALPPVRSITIANSGTAPLIVSAITLPDGYSVSGPPELPVSIAANSTLTLTVTLSAPAPGYFAGSVTLVNNDEDEGRFDFQMTGLVVAPDIAVYAGGTRNEPELSDGQAAAVDFGRNVQGAPGTRSFTFTNTGSAELLVSGVTVPAGYAVINLPAPGIRVGIGLTVTFQVALTTTAVGTYPGNLVIASDDPDEAVFDFPVTGEIYVPEPGAGIAGSSTSLNRQTGLQEQTIHITNDTTATVPAFNLILRGLPPGVQVNNASETRPDGSVVIYVRGGMLPHGVQDIVIEYYSAERAAGEISPQISTEVVLNPPDLTVPAGAEGLAIENVKRLAGGEMLIEFTTMPGKRYQVQYSSGGQPWQMSLPLIRAASNRTQWIDRGLPRTDSPPAQAGSRFYRVALVP